MKYKGFGDKLGRMKAINAVSSWAEISLKDYPEPRRSQIRRGDPIGYPRNKMLAAALMSIYPKVPVRELALRVGVKPTVLSVWRTQDEFRQKQSNFAKKLGQHYAEILVGSATEKLIQERWSANKDTTRSWSISTTDSHVLSLRSTRERAEQVTGTKFIPADDELFANKEIIEIDDGPDRWTRLYENVSTEFVLKDIIPVVAYLNEDGLGQFLNFVKDHLYITEVLGALSLLHGIDFFWEGFDDSKIREWVSQPWLSNLTRAAIFKSIDKLADPKFHEEQGPEEAKKLANTLKLQMNYLIDTTGQ